MQPAEAEGRDCCSGWRPRAGRDSFEQFYKQLKLSHGVVSHNKHEWTVVKSVVVCDADGAKRTIKLKHGTEAADGTWAEVKEAFPKALHSSDHDRIAEYIYAWAWRARRHGQDLFVALGRGVRREQ